MNERFTERNQQPRPYETISTTGWSDPTRREAFEQGYRTQLGEYGHHFDASQYRQYTAVNVIANAVVSSMVIEQGDVCGFQPVSHAQFPNGKFSGGVILLGAASRELAEQFQPDFTDRVNDVLEDLEANIRLGEHRQ